MNTHQTAPQPKLIHIGKFFEKGRWNLLFLRQLEERHFEWFIPNENWEETATDVKADSIQEAQRLAVKAWKINYFRYLLCGFRYNLPERDEHGINALFHQMAASLSTSNGIYFDEELGHNCYVQNASNEARELLQKLRTLGKL